MAAALPPEVLAVAAAKPLYDHDGPVAVAVGWSLFTVSTILLAARFYVTFGMRRPGGWPLIWLCVTYVFSVAATCSASVAASFGMGNHVLVVAAHGTGPPSILWTWITLVFEIASYGPGKCAVAALLLSLLGTTGRLSKIFLIGLACVNVAIDVSIMIAAWFQCSPPRKLWLQTEVDGTCNGVIPVMWLGITAGIVNALSDVIFAVYPSFIIWKLNMAKRIKLGLVILLSLGIFTGVSSAIKTSKVKEISNTTDPSYATGSLVIWGLVEMWIVLIVCTVPQVWPLVRDVTHKAKTTISGSRNFGSHTPKSNTYGSNYHNGVAYSPSGVPDYGLRGGDTKTSKQRGYVEHSSSFLPSPSENDTTALRGDCIMMTHEYKVEKDMSSQSVRERGARGPSSYARLDDDKDGASNIAREAETP